tara:strand:+ start:765 stop:2771 length:2007 start_codon:yes stop_codon:yes gene_type:complete
LGTKLWILKIYKMKKIKTRITYLFMLILAVACTDNLRDLSFVENVAAPANVSASFTILQDNTGTVSIAPSAEGAVNFDIYFGDATVDPVNINQGSTVEHIYGENTFTVKVVAFNMNGDATEVSEELVVSFQAPQNLVVTLENDVAISKQVNIKATADFAAMYEFYSGEDGVTQPVISGNIGNSVSYQYAEPGTYTVKVVAKGGAIETTEYTVDFEVTAILAPIESAAKPPSRNDADVVSVFSGEYTDIADSDFYPNWGQSTQFTAFDLNGDAMLQYSDLNYQGINLGAAIDASSLETLHIDIWTSDATSIDIFPLPNGVQPADEKFVTKTLIADQWNSFDIPMSEFTDQGLSVDDLMQFKFVGSGTVFLDNIYFYRASTNVIPFDSGLLTNGDFESGSDSWLVGVDDSSAAPVVTVAGNTYYSVNVTSAGQPYTVNTSQKVEIIEGNTYTLTFDAWSDADRTFFAGIGLSNSPWTNKTESVSITATRTSYKYTYVANFGASDARVLFDLGAETGLVNIDNVSLVIGLGNLLTNGNFENGSDSWLVGVDDTSSAPVVTVAGNTYYSVDVTSAGQPYTVNTSQKVEIIEGKTYTLIFDAWSNVERTIIAGIGLSASPWDNKAESVAITTTRKRYTLTLDAAFGAPDARVLFDLGAEIGSVNIDDVYLSTN